MRARLSLAKYGLCVWVGLWCAVGGPASASSFCPVVCTCKWKSGKQSVECNDKGLIAIPEGIDKETQLLDMSNNNLQVLPKETFIRAALLDLQKVYLRNCRIGQIDDRALRGLSNVVDLDVSRNLLTSVPSSMFEDVPNLRNLSLAHNPIQKIDASAFRHVSSLTKLDLSYCQITIIAPRAFEGVEYLEQLRLNGNKLSELKLKTVDTLSSLHGVELHDNPWYCDCSLRTLKLWLTQKNIPYPIEPLCNGGPSRVYNKAFNQLHADDFACKPEIKIKLDSRYIESAAGDNATIQCKVESIPTAAISWYWNGRLLLNNTAFSPFQRIVIHELGEADKRSVLTLTNAQESDSSQFYCVAENQAGTAEANFTLRVVHRLAGFALFGNTHVTGISLALVGLILTILVVIAYLLHRIRKMPTTRELKHSAAGEDIIPNGAIHSATDNKSLTIEPSADLRNAAAYSPASSYIRNEAQTLPRMSYSPAGVAFQDQRVGGGAARSLYHTDTSNPDLIADTRYQEDIGQISGEYTRTNDLFYPSSLWNENELQKMFPSSNGDFHIDTNDKTPIIEDVESLYESCQCDPQRHPHVPRALKEYEFPTTSSLPESAAGSTTATGAGAGAATSVAYGPTTDAKIMRVWQNGVHVLPPVTALKRVLNRNSPDEGYQEGCGTDV